MIAEHVRCREFFCGGIMRAVGALIECQACFVTRFASAAETLAAKKAWEGMSLSMSREDSLS